MEPLEEKLDLIERTLEAAHAISAKLGYLPPGNQKQI
jgi:hypothetical protein